MVLSYLAITVIRGNIPLREKIGTELGLSDQAIKRHLRDNKPHGKLTSKGIIDMVCMETGLLESQIVEHEKVEA